MCVCLCEKLYCLYIIWPINFQGESIPALTTVDGGQFKPPLHVLCSFNDWYGVCIEYIVGSRGSGDGKSSNVIPCTLYEINKVLTGPSATM